MWVVLCVPDGICDKTIHICENLCNLRIGKIQRICAHPSETLSTVERRNLRSFYRLGFRVCFGSRIQRSRLPDPNHHLPAGAIAPGAVGDGEEVDGLGLRSSGTIQLAGRPI